MDTSKSVLEVLNLALTDQMEDKAPKLNVQPTDRVLGELKNTLVPKLLTVVGHFGLAASQPGRAPLDINMGIEAILNLMISELVREYGSELRLEENITVRWKEGGWVVVGVLTQTIAQFVEQPSRQN